MNMRNRLMCIITLIVPLITIAQTKNKTSFTSAQDESSTPLRAGSGIKWITGITWEQVKQKAKQENKNIFLDCFASWCIPCRAMDKDIYTNDTVGNVMNDKFICVKVQMDKTSID